MSLVVEQSISAEPSSIVINPEEMRLLLERLSARDGVLGDGRATVADVAEATSLSPDAVLRELSEIRRRTPSAHEIAQEIRSIEMRQEMKIFPYALIFFALVMAGAIMFKLMRQERLFAPAAPTPISVPSQGQLAPEPDLRVPK